MKLYIAKVLGKPKIYKLVSENMMSWSGILESTKDTNAWELGKE